MKVTWTIASGFGHDVPLFEQHALGSGLTNGGHGSCAPTSVAANLRWLDDSGLAQVVPAGWSDQTLVQTIGAEMGTAGGTGRRARA